MQKPTMRYFLYARKSTDEADKQVLSIEAQLAELREYAKKENLPIVREFIECKTAKEPGREIFNEMVSQMEQGAAYGIVAWHPDRLARNSVDGGRIIYLVDTAKILELKFPTFWFDPTPQGKFMLSIAFGQSKYYVDNLSENVKRGLRQKLRNGIWPSRAPMGYLNDTVNHTIYIDKEREPLIRQAFELFGSGTYSIREIREFLKNAGLVGRNQKKALSIGNCHHMLRNPIYYGVIRYYGELHEAKHEPIIPKALFDKCQELLKNKSKPKKRGFKPYVYRGTFRCEGCGCFITTETQKGHNYLRCTKRKSPCNERFTREEEVDRQVRELLEGVSLPPALAANALDNIKADESKAAQAGEEAAQNLRDKLVILTDQLGQLLDMVLQGSITQPEYVTKKAQLVNEKKEIENKLAAFARQGAMRFEPLKRFYELCVVVGESAVAGSSSDNLQIMRKIGSNFLLGGQKIKLKFNFPSGEVQKLHALPGFGSADFCNSINWRPLRDSNP
ncbi:MAG: recombinase family protein [Elusimicrobiales bacterium]|nr:recombinase family protein [Elusimicrobiales bacterium]